MRIDAACAHVRLDGVGIRWKRSVLDEDLPPGTIGAVEADHEQVQVHREGVHHHDFTRLRTDESCPGIPEDLVVAEPRSPGFDMSLHAEIAPIIEFLDHQFTGTPGHEPEGVAAEVGGGSTVLMLWDLDTYCLINLAGISLTASTLAMKSFARGSLLNI